MPDDKTLRAYVRDFRRVSERDNVLKIIHVLYQLNERCRREEVLPVFHVSFYAAKREGVY